MPDWSDWKSIVQPGQGGGGDWTTALQQQQQDAAPQDPAWLSTAKNVGGGVLDAVSRVTTPLTYLKQLLWSGAEDVTSLSGDHPFENKFLQTVEQTPNYIGAVFGGQRPTEYSTPQTFLQNVAGVSDAPAWAKIATDFLVDPLLFGSWLSGIGKGAKLLGETGLGNDLMTLGSKVNYSTSLSGMVENSIRAVTPGVARPNGFAMEWLGKNAAEFLAKPSPFSKPLADSAFANFDPAVKDQLTKYNWGEILFPFGVVPGTNNTPLGRLAQAIQAGKQQRAFVGNIATAASQNIDNALREVTDPLAQAASKAAATAEQGAAPSALSSFLSKFSTPKSPTTGTPYSTLYDEMNALAGEWADNLKSTNYGAAGRLAASNMASRADKAAAGEQLLAEGENATYDLFAASKTRERFQKKAESLATAFGADPVAAINAVEYSAKELFRASSIIGSMLSGGPKFMQVVEEAASSLGVDKYTFLQNLAKGAAKPESSPLNATLAKPLEKLSAAGQDLVEQSENPALNIRPDWYRADAPQNTSVAFKTGPTTTYYADATGATHRFQDNPLLSQTSWNGPSDITYYVDKTGLAGARKSLQQSHAGFMVGDGQLYPMTTKADGGTVLGDPFTVSTTPQKGLYPLELKGGTDVPLPGDVKGKAYTQSYLGTSIRDLHTPNAVPTATTADVAATPAAVGHDGVLTVFSRDFSAPNAFGNTAELPQRPGLLAALNLDDTIKNPKVMAQMLAADPQTVYSDLVSKMPQLASVITPQMRPAEMLEQYGLSLARGQGYNVIRLATEGDNPNLYTDLYLRGGVNPAQISDPTKQSSIYAAAFTGAAKKLGLNEFTTVDPEIFLKNYTEGYARKLYMTQLNPAATQQKVMDGMIVPYYGLEYDAFRNAFSSAYGQAAGDAVTQYLKGRDTGVVNAIGLANVLSVNLKRTVDPAEVANILKGVSPENQLTDKTLRLLTRKTDVPQRPSTGSFEFSMSNRRFVDRINQDADSLLLENQAATSRMAQLGLVAGKAIDSQTVLDMTHDLLKEMGVFAPGPMQNTAGTIYAGLKYVTLPSDENTWGALAGKSIPLWAARNILSIIHAPGEDRLPMLGRFINGIRAGFLSGAGTTIHNITGNLAILQQQGVDIPEVIPYFKTAYAALQRRDQGLYAPEFAGAEDLLNFFSDGTLSRSVNKSVQDNLLASWGEKPTEDWVDKTTNFMHTLANTMPFGWLHAFQKSEDIMRAGTFLWAKNKLMAQGKDEVSAIQEAARFANNSLYDYSSVGQGVNMLRRSGLALFPAFTYFTVGLTARQLWERPQTLAIEDKYINAANQLSVPDDRERNRLSRIIQDTWMSENRPIPIPAGNGKYYLLPMNAFLPQGSLSQNNITSLYLDPMMGGFFKPLIDMAAAISSGNGQAPLTSASGPNARVYNPMDSLPDKVAQTGGFLAQAYMPTPLRTAISIANKLPMAVNPEMAARAADTLDKWQNTDVAQILAKPFGANLYTYDTNGRSARGRSRQIMAQYKSDLQSWQAEFKAAAATGNSGQLQRLVMQRRDMEQNVQQSLNTVWGQ